ncbi:MAG TPA: branched-chain amino acid transaminase [Burkholderiales bacterium]|nr:branched-chain amino acid transaminase [Burkholderiales bacterium]
MDANPNFPKARKYWYNGKFHDWSKTQLHPMAHALHYGTSVFEGIRAYATAKGSAVFRLPEHIDRFLLSASVAKMSSPYSKDEIIRTIKMTVRENRLESCYIRPLLFYSYGNLGLVPKACPVELAIAAWEWGAYLGEKAEQGTSGFIGPWRRVHHTQLNMAAKLGGIYVQSTINGLEARAQGCDEAIFLNMEGRIAEGPGENIFIVKDKALVTNDRKESVLEGITRSSLLEIALDLGHDTVVGSITKEDLFTADEAFFSGTAVEVIPIVRVVDASTPGGPRTEHVIGNGKVGPITKEMTKAYREVVAGKTPGYEKWLTFVHE